MGNGDKKGIGNGDKKGIGTGIKRVSGTGIKGYWKRGSKGIRNGEMGEYLPFRIHFLSPLVGRQNGGNFNGENFGTTLGLKCVWKGRCQSDSNVRVITNEASDSAIGHLLRLPQRLPGRASGWAASLSGAASWHRPRHCPSLARARSDSMTRIMIPVSQPATMTGLQSLWLAAVDDHSRDHDHH